jgi:hypothetical protein
MRRTGFLPEFLWKLWWLWVGLMSGIASLVLYIIGLVKDLGTPGLPFWLSGYVCLVVAAGMVVYGLRREIAALKETLGLTDERRREAQGQLAGLSAGQRDALRQLLVKHRASGGHVRINFPGVDFVDLARVTTFLDHDRGTDCWSIHPVWRGVLGELFFAKGSSKPLSPP